MKEVRNCGPNSTQLKLHLLTTFKTTDTCHQCPLLLLIKTKSAHIVLVLMFGFYLQIIDIKHVKCMILKITGLPKHTVPQKHNGDITSLNALVKRLMVNIKKLKTELCFSSEGCHSSD